MEFSVILLLLLCMVFVNMCEHCDAQFGHTENFYFGRQPCGSIVLCGKLHSPIIRMPILRTAHTIEAITQYVYTQLIRAWCRVFTAMTYAAYLYFIRIRNVCCSGACIFNVEYLLTAVNLISLLLQSDVFPT